MLMPGSSWPCAGAAALRIRFTQLNSTQSFKASNNSHSTGGSLPLNLRINARTYGLAGTSFNNSMKLASNTSSILHLRSVVMGGGKVRVSLMTASPVSFELAQVGDELVGQQFNRLL